MTDKLSPYHLEKKALIYVRQSTVIQTKENLESQRRQYALAYRAKEMGFRQVDVIDDDLGRSGSGTTERPGFQRLVSEVCTGDVGAVFCIEASRLARNGRDWHHLIDLCGVVKALVIDPEGIYDPCNSNDRLVLGLKGTMSEFELTLLRQRSLEAIRSKAKRGELQFCLPIGLLWTRNGRIELDPDRRVQTAIYQVFDKFVELGSARQILLWFRGEHIKLPANNYGEFGRELVWKLPVYNSIIHILQNPLYAGGYAFGKTEVRTRVVNGRVRKSDGHRKPREQWTVLIRDHHPGYISWERFETNQRMLEENAHMKQKMSRKSGRGGRALLAGLIRCARCGRMLHVAYSGVGGRVPRYHCKGAHLNHGADWCISFGGLRPDQVVSTELMRVLEGNAIDAALEASRRAQDRVEAAKKALELEREQAQYEARLAARRYEAVDPANRLVADELESRWNKALERIHELDIRIAQADALPKNRSLPDRESLMALARDLPTVWNDPNTDMRLKQRIVHILVEEIVADIDEDKSEVILIIHWAGGRHSELRFPKNKTGQHSRSTNQEAVDVIAGMAGRWPDEQIAATLNRLGMRTGAGNSWTEGRVRSYRSYRKLPAFDPERRDSSVCTLEQASQHLGVSARVVRRLINEDILPGKQVAPCAPWEIPVNALDLDSVQKAVEAVRSRRRRPRAVKDACQPTMIPDR